MKRVFETAECEAVRNSIFWELGYEKHMNRMKGCDVEQKVSVWQMNACYYVYVATCINTVL